MKNDTRILLIGDKGIVRQKISDQLNRLDFHCTVNEVDTIDELKTFFTLQNFDLVLCDFNFSNCSGLDVLFYVRERELQIPFIFISDTVWEDATIDTLILNGVTDYVQADHLKELEFIIRREVHRYQHIRNTQRLLKASEQRFQSLVQSINGILRIIDLETLKNVYVSPQSMKILGYPAKDWLENRYFWLEQTHPKDRVTIIEKMNQLVEKGGNQTLEYRMINSQGEIIWIRDLLSIRKENDTPVSLDSLMIDITNEKEIESQRDLALHQEKIRMKEQKCLWNITNLDEQSLSVQQLLQRALMLIPIGFQYPESVGVRIMLGEDEFINNRFNEEKIMLKSEYVRMQKEGLLIQISYEGSDEFQDDEYPFLKDEQHLLDTICDILAIKIAKKRSTEDLKKHEKLLITTYELAQLGQVI